MSAVAKRIGESASSCIVALLNTATELGVSGQNSAVHDVGETALAAASIITISGRAAGSTGDRSQAPWSTCLTSQDFKGVYLVGLDSSNLSLVSSHQ